MDLLLEKGRFFCLQTKNKTDRKTVGKESNKVEMKITKNTNWWWRNNFLQIP